MHDPMVVAFDILRPWPRRDTSFRLTPDRRWQIRHHHECWDECEQRENHAKRNPFPWWRPGSYSRFWRLAGRWYYWPPLITIWHVEPDGHDSGAVCKQFRTGKDGQRKVSNRWRWHVHHWKLQIHPFQKWRRWLLTRCEWCHGRSRAGDPVNISYAWDRERAPWWRGERGLYHRDCSSVRNAHRVCLCVIPKLDREGWGQCGCCGRWRSFGQVPNEAHRLLAALEPGSRIPADLKPRIDAIWAEANRDREVQK